MVRKFYLLTERQRKLTERQRNILGFPPLNSLESKMATVARYKSRL